MAVVKFAAGQHVSLLGARTFSASAPKGVYRVVSALPREQGPQTYRVRSDGENHDRIVEESRLEAVGL
jgi:hypothetical protein